MLLIILRITSFHAASLVNLIKMTELLNLSNCLTNPCTSYYYQQTDLKMAVLLPSLLTQYGRLH